MSDAPAEPSPTSAEVSVDAGPAPAYPPRAVTDRVRRATWSEPRVRFWLLVAGVLLAADLFVLAEGLLAAWRDARLFDRGQVVSALIVDIEGDGTPGHGAQPPARTHLRYELNGQTYDPISPMEEYGKWIRVGDTIPIRVDPGDPTTWTGRADRPSPLSRTATAIALAPVVLAAGLFAWSRRGRLLRAWQGGDAVPAVVLDSKHVAVAPKSRVRCSPVEPGDTRVMRVYVPASAARIKRGDLLWIVVPPRRSADALAALWVE